MAIKIPKGHEIFQKYAFQGLPNYTKIGIFGLVCKSGNPAISTHAQSKDRRLRTNVGRYVGKKRNWNALKVELKKIERKEEEQV
jgi:hypothetical protein